MSRPHTAYNRALAVAFLVCAGFGHAALLAANGVTGWLAALCWAGWLLSLGALLIVAEEA